MHCMVNSLFKIMQIIKNAKRYFLLISTKEKMYIINIYEFTLGIIESFMSQSAMREIDSAGGLPRE